MLASTVLDHLEKLAAELWRGTKQLNEKKTFKNKEQKSRQTVDVKQDLNI